MTELDPLFEPLATRLRRRDQAWGVAVVAGAGAFASWLLALAEDRWGWQSRAPWVLLLAAVVVLGAAWHRRRGKAPLDEGARRALARRIEAHDPSLRGRLLTAVEQTPAGPDGRLDVLQSELVADVARRADGAAWAAAIPKALPWGGVVLAALAATLLVVNAAPSLWPGLPAFFPDGYGLRVSPGSTEVLRGTPVLVEARFDRQVPADAALIVRVPGRPATRIAMTRALADPVFTASVPPIDVPRIDYRIEYAGHTSARFHVLTYVLPEVLSVDARVFPPGADAPPVVERVDVRRLKVVEGARVTLTAHLNAPARATLTEPDDASHAFTTVDATTVAATFSPRASGGHAITLVDDAGRSSAHPFVLDVEVEQNHPARVITVFPGRDVRVIPVAEVAIEAKADDDLGLGAWGLSWAVAGQKPREVRLGAGGRSATLRHLLALEELGLAPGALVTYHAWAEDRDAAGRLRRTDGDLGFIEIRPYEETFREGPQGGAGRGHGRGEGGEALIERQRDVLNATWRLRRQATAADLDVVHTSQIEVERAAAKEEAAARSEAARVALAEARRHMAAAAKALAAAKVEVRALDDAVAAEQAALVALLRLEQRDHSVSRGRPGEGGGGGGAERPALSDLELKQQERRYETRSQAEGDDRAVKGGAQAEDRQVLSRLKALARRQDTIGERLRELEAALRAAPEEAKQAQAEHLERLRDDERELLAELDEIGARMEREGNRERMSDARQALEGTRAEALEAAQALARGDLPRASASSSRASRGLDRVRADLQRRVAKAFTEEMEDLRTRARRLDEDQARTEEALAQASRSGTDVARTYEAARQAAEALERQRREAGALLERMRQVTEAAEPTSPLLARKLYEELRKTRAAGLEDALAVAALGLRRNAIPETDEPRRRARTAAAELRRGVDQAAGAVLGDDADALRSARSTVERLMEEAGRGAVAGEGFRALAEGLREVEELVGRPALAHEAARVRERARSLRSDLRRNARAPSTALWEEELVRPLGTLRDRIDEELARLAPGETLAPIDRDPVPPRYSDAVRRYYRSLGGGR